MTFIEIENTRYHYVELGSGQPMLLLHGFTGCAENWAQVMQRLASRHRVIVLDLPGHGLTRAPDDITQFTMPVVSQQVAQLITAVVGGPVHLLGYSMGGRLALHMALEYPAVVQTLTLESASPGLENADERAARIASDEALAERIEREGMAAFVAEWERLPLWASQQAVSEDKRARLHAQRLQNHPHSLALSLRGMGTGAQPSLWHRLGQLNAPTRLLAGERDTKFVAVARRMMSAIPKCALRVIPHSGHAIHFEQPEAVVANIG